LEALDEIDVQILRLLQKDGRMSYADLSRRLGVPQSTIRFKVSRLIKLGFIKKIVAILDPCKLGYKITLIMLLKIDTKRSNQIFAHIAKMKEAHHVLQITGKYDVAAIFHAKDMDHANNIISNVKKMEGVFDAETLIATGKFEIKTELDL